MPLPDPPDLARPRTRLIAAAFLVALVVGAVTGIPAAPQLARSLGDTDDATRLVLVRALLHGQGWWDAAVMRLQPPRGVFMHWSRLLDGGIAGLDWLFSRFLPPAGAEWMTRFLWPLLWVFPGALGALLLSEDLAAEPDGRPGARGAGLVCAVFLVTTYSLYIQFRPGRVDHHDVQMVLYLLALAGACERRRPGAGAVLAGVSTGLGLAVGLEALVFDAVIGAAFAVRFLIDAPTTGRLRAYGLALALTTALAYAVQTPPGRWLLPACDALAVNLVAAACIAGLGVAAVAATLSGAGRISRAGALGAVAALAALAYLGLDPRCIKGPFADVDPALKLFWLPHVQEMRPFPVVLKQKPDDALILGIPILMGAAGALWLLRRRRRWSDGNLLLCGALLLITGAVGFSGIRMAGYADWTAVPILAAAGADLAEAAARRFRRDRLIPLLFAALLLTPELLTNGVVEARDVAVKLMQKKGAPARKEPGDHCFDTAAYRALQAAGPPGLVLSEIDLGPFILANSQDSVLAAPYHRMSWGLVQARRALSAPADAGSEAATRRLGVAYLLECRAHRRRSDRDGMGPDSLQRRLDAGQPPAWLQRTDKAGSVLEIFRLAPAGGPERPAPAHGDGR